MSLNDYAPTADEWKSWLLKPQWTAAEAAALSLGISPDLTKVSRQESHRPTDRVLSFGDEPPEEPIVIAYWNIVLEGKGRAAGLSTEKLLYLRTRDLAASGLISKNINLKNKSHWDFSNKLTPSDCIAQMQYWEWALPIEILGKSEPQYSDTLMLPEIALALGVSVNDLRVIVESGNFVKVYGEGGEQWKTNEVISWAKANGRSFDLAKLPPPKPLSEERLKYGDKMTIKDIADFIGRDPRTVQSYIRKKIDPADFGGWQGSRAEWLTDKFVDKYKALKKLK